MYNVGPKESNESEPIDEASSREYVDVKSRVLLSPYDEFGGNLFTVQMTSGVETARTWARHLCGTCEPIFEC